MMTVSGADRALALRAEPVPRLGASRFDHGEGMAPTLDAFARKWGIPVDLTPLARQEQAFNDMLSAALGRDDAAWTEAKARFEQATKGTVE